MAGHTAEALVRRVRDVAAEGLAAAGRVEQGQADKPLSRHFEQLARPLEGRLCIALLGTSPEARGRLLRWLTGREVNFLTVRDSGAGSMIQVELSDGGYALEGPAGARQEFDSFESFLDGLQQTDILRPDDDDPVLAPLSIRLPANGPSPRLSLLIPLSVEAVLDYPSTLSRIAEEADLAVLAAPADAQLSADERDAMQEVCTVVELALPVAVEGSGPAPRRGWWRDREIFADALALEPVVFGASDPQPPQLITAPNGEGRQLLTVCRGSSALLRATDLLLQRFGDEQSQLAAQRAALGRKLQAVEANARGGGSRQTLERLRTTVQSGFQGTLRGLDEESKHLLRPSSGALSRFADLLDDLDQDDLAEEQGRKATILTLRSSTEEGFERELRNVVRKALTERCRRLERELSELSQRITDDVASAGLGSTQFEPPRFDDDALYRSATELISFNLRYRGELPLRTFMARLSEGRRAMYAVMTLMIFGGSLGISRSHPAILGLMVLLFFGGVAWSYVSWEREDDERLDKELERAREALAGEGKRVFSEVEREVAGRLNRQLQEHQKGVARQIDELVRSGEAKARASLDRERNALRERTRMVEQRSREAGNGHQALSRLQRAAGEVQRDSRRALRDHVRASRDPR